jgi:citrate synthase
MDLLRSGVSALGAADADVNDNSYDANLCKAKRLIGQIATLIPASHRIQNGQEPIVPRTDLGHAANLLYMLNGQEPANNAVRGLEIIKYPKGVKQRKCRQTTFQGQADERFSLPRLALLS